MTRDRGDRSELFVVQIIICEYQIWVFLVTGAHRWLVQKHSRFAKTTGQIGYNLILCVTIHSPIMDLLWKKKVYLLFCCILYIFRLLNAWDDGEWSGVCTDSVQFVTDQIKLVWTKTLNNKLTKLKLNSSTQFSVDLDARNGLCTSRTNPLRVTVC